MNSKVSKCHLTLYGAHFFSIRINLIKMGYSMLVRRVSIHKGDAPEVAIRTNTRLVRLFPFDPWFIKRCSYIIFVILPPTWTMIYIMLISLIHDLYYTTVIDLNYIILICLIPDLWCPHILDPWYTYNLWFILS